MSPEQTACILDLIIGEIDERSFLVKYGLKRGEVSAEAKRLLEHAALIRDADAVEYGLLLGFRFEFPDGFIGMVHKLLVQDWHISHEDMIGLLQEWQDPTSVEPLREAIRLKPKLDYLDYDDYGSYYKKCLWALAAIGTADAISEIEDCTGSANPVLREQALYRLDKLSSRARPYG